MIREAYHRPLTDIIDTLLCSGLIKITNSQAHTILSEFYLQSVSFLTQNKYRNTVFRSK